VLRASKGLSKMQGKALRDVIFEFRDIWSLRLSADGPEEVTPLKVHLKPDVVPRRAKARRYAPRHLDLIRRQIKLHEEMGYMSRSAHTRCSSPVLMCQNLNRRMSSR